MTLDSGDRIFFNVTSTCMVLQVVSMENLSEDNLCDVANRNGVDTVYLRGRDVALLLGRLSRAKADGCVVPGAPGSSKLLVNPLWCDAPERMTVVLETDNNVIHINVHERDMLASAIESQAWRLFQ